MSSSALCANSEMYRRVFDRTSSRNVVKVASEEQYCRGIGERREREGEVRKYASCETEAYS
tara:strand:+ start:353 stop:535 length:183 start_codon:yes stop_codon:yes gene_type:complete